MRKLIFSINMTLGGVADHRAGIADEELHDFFTGELGKADITLMGRKTYELMADYWPGAEHDTSLPQSMRDFARAFNSIEKIVFSRTLKSVQWNNARLAEGSLVDEVHRLKKMDGKHISVGSINLATQLTKLNLIDEYWFLIHPVVWGEGRRLFDEGLDKKVLTVVASRTFRSGVVVMHYAVKSEKESAPAS